MYGAQVIADSISAGSRLTTIAVTMPRIVLAEQNTHREFSRNTASSRAIPVKTRCDLIEANPFIPEVFGKNQKGMQASENLDPEANRQAEEIWREALSDALRHARRLAEVGVHKQYANRLTEAFAWVTQIVTATEWDNYMNLRVHKDAQPEICRAASLMREAMAASSPRELREGEWHLPLVSAEDEEKIRDFAQATGMSYEAAAVLVSVARCAAVSYEKHNLQKLISEETARATSLLASGHMSPFEHQAKVASANEILRYGLFRWNFDTSSFEASRIGNFRPPWLQNRKTIPGESLFRGGS